MLVYLNESKFRSLFFLKKIKDMPHCRYQAPFRTAECFFELNLPKNLLILDIGAGTGWLGQALFQNGYHWIDALDACDKMLEKAKLVTILITNYYLNVY